MMMWQRRAHDDNAQPSTRNAAPAGAFRRLWEAARGGDLARVAIVLSRRLGCGVVRLERLRILARSAWAGMPAARHGSRVGLAGAADLPQLDAAFPHNAGAYGPRLARGDRCLVLRREGPPVAMTWIRLNDAGLLLSGCRLLLPPGACWIYDTFVTPGMRGLGLFPALMRAAFAEARRLGLSRTFLAVHHDNVVSVRAHERAGYGPVLVIDSLLAGRAGFHRMTWPSGRAFWRFSSASSLPLVRLAPV